VGRRVLSIVLGIHQFIDSLGDRYLRNDRFIPGREWKTGSQLVKSNRSYDSRELRHHRGNKITVDNHDPFCRLRGEKVKRAWGQSQEGWSQGCIGEWRGIRILSVPAIKSLDS
jgi:hypothetical protein